MPDVLHLREFGLGDVTSRTDVVDAHTSIVYEQVRAPVIYPL